MMSELSGYDSEVVGFDSLNENKRSETSSSTQTSEFIESSSSSQTNLTSEFGCTTSPEDLNAGDDVSAAYPPPGLNEFLRRVMPSVMEQLDQNDKEILYNSSDSDEDETISAKLFQEVSVKSPSLEAGDQAASILDLSWSSAGNTLAVSVGHSQHEEWCQHDGLIRIYTVKCAMGDKLVHTLDISENNCVSVVKYHPTLAALLAYGTTCGEVVICNLRNTISGLFDDGIKLTSPAGCHGSRRVSCLVWADTHLANLFLMQHKNNRKRCNISDQVLISGGSDGTVNVWQVNSDLEIFSSIVCYSINSSMKMPLPDITCLDFIRTVPLRLSDEKVPDDIFIVGSKSGMLLLCSMKNSKNVLDNDVVDPVYDVLEGHSTCVLDVAFCFHKPGIFASISMDAELKIYDVHQMSALKVVCIDTPISCLSWLPNNPVLVILGLAATEGELLRVYNVSTGRAVPVEGFKGKGENVTAVAVNQNGSCRITAGDNNGSFRIWDLPTSRIRLSHEDLIF